MNNKTTLYIGSYANSDENGLYIANIDDITGEINIIKGYKGLINPSYITINNDNTKLYVTEETGDYKDNQCGGLCVYDIDDEELSFNTRHYIVVQPCHSAVTKDGKFAIVANYGGGVASIIDMRGDIPVIKSIKHHGSSINLDRQKGPHPHFAYIIGGEFYIVDLGLDQIICYDLYSLKVKAIIKMPAGCGPRHMVQSKLDENIMYVLCELSDEVITLKRIDGEYQIIDRIYALPNDIDSVSAAAAIKLSSCGNYVYTSMREHNSIAVFKIDKITGLLSMIQSKLIDGDMPRDILVLDKFILVANQNTDNILSYKIDIETGLIGDMLCNNKEIKKPVCIISDL